MRPHVKELDYPSLHNLIYYLMFTDNQDKELWEQIVQTTIDHKGVLPLIYYKPFKASFYYLKGLFPEWDGDREHFGTFLSTY